MSLAGTLTFVVVAGIVLGGFAFILATAVRSDRRREGDG